MSRKKEIEKDVTPETDEKMKSTGGAWRDSKTKYVKAEKAALSKGDVTEARTDDSKNTRK